MKQILFILCLLLCLFDSWGENVEFNFPILKTYNLLFDKKINIDNYSYGTSYSYDCDCSQLNEINLRDGVEKLLVNGIDSYLLTNKDNSLLFVRLVSNDKNTKGVTYSYTFSWYDIIEKSFRPDNIFNESKIEVRGQPLFIFYYQNEQFFVQAEPYIYGENSPNQPGKIILYNKRAKKKEDFPVPAILIDISPDKMHLLLDVFNSNELATCYIPNQKVIKGFGLARKDSAYNYAAFISNSLILSLNKNYGGPGNKTLELYRIDKPQQFYLLSLKADNRIILRPTFSNNFSKALANIGTSTEPKTVLIDTTAFRDWLLKNNLLFQSTTGTINAMQVNIRENPNLEAPVTGRLDKGTSVEVLDRSGVKMKLGAQDTWWYQVKTQGKDKDVVIAKGWVYGQYLDLAPITPIPSPSTTVKAE